MLMLTLMLMLDMVMLAQLPHLLPSVTVSQSEPATSNLSSSLIPLPLLELTPGSDQKPLLELTPG